MNYLDLFHGIGGFALGAHWAGMKFENHYCSDIEPYTQELYKLRFPDSIQLGDITKIKTADLPQGDWIISGGFPCQDISIAGKGAGIHGGRSGLWFEYWRIINDLRPRFAIMENVGMLVHRGLREVLGSLAEIGYDAEWQDIRAEDMGAPHRRERIWIVAYAKSLHDRRNIRDIHKENEKEQRSEMQYKNKARTFSNASKGNGKIPDPNLSGNRTSRSGVDKNRETQEQKRNESRPESCGHCAEIPDTDNQGLQRRPEAGNITELWKDRKQQFKRQGEQLGENYWSTEPPVGRLVNGLPGRVDRLKGLGNSIIPQIAELLFNQIKEL